MIDELLVQAVQVTGSLMILAAFIAVQAGRMRPDWRSYLTLNFLGSATLTVTGIIESQWGFVLLEGVWAIVSLASLVNRRRQAAIGH